MNIFYSNDIIKDKIVLKEEEFTHCIKSLRKKKGDLIRITNGKGMLFECELDEIKKRECSLIILNETVSEISASNLSIAIAPTKNISRYEWFLEKAVEIGISNIYPFTSYNSERRRIRLDRLEKIALSAMKQSVQYHLPIVHELISFNDLMGMDWKEHNRFIAHLDEESKPMHSMKIEGKTLILIGPEGDFSKEEIGKAIENDFCKMSLGKTRLRTETAGVVACTLFNNQ